MPKAPRRLKSDVECKAWLYNVAVKQRLSVPKIAVLAGCGTWKVFNRMKRFGIPRNPVGHNLSSAGGDNFMKTPGVINPFLGKCHSQKTRQLLSRRASVPKPYLRGSGNGMYGQTGASNPNWKGGSAFERQVIYENRQWKDLSRRVRRRDGYKCYRCGAIKQRKKCLHLHHILGWTEYPKYQLVDNNVVTLCKSCHDWVHSKSNAKEELVGLHAYCTFKSLDNV